MGEEIIKRVKVNPLWDEFESTKAEHGGLGGTIEYSDFGFTVVNWDTGISSSVPDYALMPEEGTAPPKQVDVTIPEMPKSAVDKLFGKSFGDIIFDEVAFNPFQPQKKPRPTPKKAEVPQYRISQGMRVIPNPTHEEYSAYYSQHKNNMGTVMSVDLESGYDETRMIASVRWDNGHKNGYRPAMLLEHKDGMERPLEPLAFPFLAGQRVQVNLDTLTISEKKKVGDGKGVVVDPLLNDGELSRWKRRRLSEKECIYVKIRFDNGYIYNYYSRDIKSIAEPSIDIERYELSQGDVLYKIPGVECELFDVYIIQQGQRISRITTYDEDWRQRIIESIKNS